MLENGVCVALMEHVASRNKNKIVQKESFILMKFGFKQCFCAQRKLSLI